MDNLLYAADDAREFAATLKRKGWAGDHIMLLTDEQATERAVKLAVDGWLSKAGPKDTIVIYWSGHGYPDPEDLEKVYFACYDTDPTIPATGYRMDRLRLDLEEHDARNVVVLADTCHAGKLVTRDGDKAIGVSPYVKKIEREKKVPKGWVFMVGADTDPKAIEHTSWKHGAFAHCLLQAMRGEADGYHSAGPKDGRISLAEIRAYMTTAMPDQTQRVLGVAKHPIIATSSGDPEIWNLTLQGES